MNEQEKELKRIVDLLESRLGDSDNYLPEEPMTPSEFEEEYPVEAAMQIAVKLMLEARSSPTQGADARPVAISDILAVLDDLYSQDSAWCRGDALDLTRVWELRKQLQSEKGVT